MSCFEKTNICVVGLGYVGLPLSLLFAKKFNTVGFDISEKRIEQLKNGIDITRESSLEELKSTRLNFTTDQKCLSESNFVIVTVPTPIDQNKKPDLTSIISASKTIGKNIKPGTIIVYESTVFPGLTEEICVPIIEKESGLKWLKDFNIAYSPERVNPGDKIHTIDKIMKVVSGDTSDTLNIVSEVYGSIISAGIHRAQSIKVAEAAKVIENTQRDVNIALMNELSILFNSMKISTKDVLNAAATKWNFLNFTPGLVGGHCIGVDPYYLTYKAEELGHHPEVILSGRKINDGMGKYVARQTIKNICKAGKSLIDNKILIAGFTFKENVPDIRNTKVIDIVTELKEFGISVDIYDPISNLEELEHEYAVKGIKSIEPNAKYAAILIAVKHNQFLEEFKYEKCASLQTGRVVISDLKGVIDPLSLPEDTIYFSL